MASCALLEEAAGATDCCACYVRVIVALGPKNQEIVVEGSLAGTIAPDRRGDEGFGYDPIFVPDRRDAHRGGARQRVESRAFAPRAGRCGVGGRPGNPGERLKPLRPLPEPFPTATGSFAPMELNEALAELMKLWSQVEDAAILGEDGFVLAQHWCPERGEQLAAPLSCSRSRASRGGPGGQRGIDGRFWLVASSS